jgi:hypothetical protein
MDPTEIRSVRRQVKPSTLRDVIGLHDILAAAVRPKPRMALLAWAAFLTIWWLGCTWWSFATISSHDAAIVSVILGAFGLIIYAVGSVIIRVVDATVDQAIDDAKRRLRRRKLIR